MNKCLNCSAEIVQKNGGKERKFCDNNNACKQAYFNKQKKEPKYVKLSSFQELKNELDIAKLKIEEMKKYPFVPKGVFIDADLINTEPKEIVTVTLPKANGKTELADWHRKQMEERIAEIEAELKKPPKNPLIGLRTWTRVRQEELEKLKKELAN